MTLRRVIVLGIAALLGGAATITVQTVQTVQTVLAGLDGRGPAASVLCDDWRVVYARAPMPAPFLTTKPATMRVGETRVVGGGYGAPLSTWSPHLIGDASLVRMDMQVFPTSKRCDRVLAGYRWAVLTAVRPGVVTVLTESDAGGADMVQPIRIVA